MRVAVACVPTEEDEEILGKVGNGYTLHVICYDCIISMTRGNSAIAFLL